MLYKIQSSESTIYRLSYAAHPIADHLPIKDTFINILSYTVWTTTFPTASAGENAKNMSAAMIPTGKNRSIKGGGGSGGNINGRNTIEAVNAASNSNPPMPKGPKLFAIVQSLSFTLVIVKTLIISRQKAINEYSSNKFSSNETLPKAEPQMFE